MEVHDDQAETVALPLSRAILIYEEPYHKEKVVLTIHEVHAEARQAVQILPGRCLGADELVELLVHAQQKGKFVRRVLPERLLYWDAALMLWWLPEQSRPLFFRSEKAFTEAMAGKPVPHPPLLFMARPGSLHLYALAKNERPTASTVLYQAPYYNIWSGGHMCRGNVSLPDALVPGEIEKWEELFFQTNFTHSNAGARCAFKGGHNALWKKLAGAKAKKPAFRAEWLLPQMRERDGAGKLINEKDRVQLTLGDLLGGETLGEDIEDDGEDD
jgi:PRTRC genetic system protein B